MSLSVNSKEERNARARDNQRLSRARRMDYISTLEARIRHFEQEGITATKELQYAARTVEKQNTQLKSWLVRSVGLRESDLQQWLRMPTEQAESCFNSFMLTRATGIPTESHSRSGYSDMPKNISPQNRRSPKHQLGMAHDVELSRRQSMPQMPRPNLYWPHSDMMPEASMAANPFDPHDRPSLSHSLPQTHSHSRSQEPLAYDYNSGTNYRSQDALYMRDNRSDHEHHYLEGQFGPNDQQSTLGFAHRDQVLSGQWIAPNEYQALSGLSNDTVRPKCAEDLGPIGQQFCTLLNLLAPSERRTASDAEVQMTCRDSYNRLQHILGNIVSVEEVVGKLMSTAVLADGEEGSYVDPGIVKDILAQMGVHDDVNDSL